MLNSNKREFQEMIEANKLSFYWIIPDNLYIPDEGGETPPSAEDWFFVIYTSRTGSTVLTNLLSLHPDVLCTSENNVLTNMNAILRSSFICSKGNLINWRTATPHVLTAQDYRELMETWRKIKIRHDKPEAKIFGDKSWVYSDIFYEGECINMCKTIFPKCKIIMTYRINVMDQISSISNQEWCSISTEDDIGLAEFRNEILSIKNKNDYIAKHSDSYICFENMTTMEGFKDQMTKTFECLGADPEKYPWEEGFSMCHHGKSIGRSKEDPLIKRLLEKYPELEEYAEYQLPMNLRR